MSILDKINSHDDLADLNDDQRRVLCDDIRRFMVESVARTGGHLASNLGIVELAVALETVFDTREDRLVFDVGHQSYVHKLLTGRKDNFAGLRQFGGMAGFPKPGESVTDAFVAGHASSSVSIALGMARARTLMGDNYHVIAVIGDGATTGGLAYEGLNDAGDSGEPLIVILNDNKMSIDRNVGGMSRQLARLRTAKSYFDFKRLLGRTIKSLPGGKYLFRVAKKFKDTVKQSLLPPTIFEGMGFEYLGPVDGHDLHSLLYLLRLARDMKGPVLIHITTRKGKGYLPAEEDPAKFHGIGKFDPATGKTLGSGNVTFSDTFGQTMMELAGNNDRVCAITAAMPGGTGLLKFKEQFPNRTFDVGIAEEHAVSMAGGLAKQGMTPVVAIYSTFLQRSYDMILQDVAMLGLHVVFAVDRSGLVGEDGETHHGAFDVGFLRHAPGMTILCPASCKELSHMLRWAVNDCSGPVAVRYPRGGDGAYSGSEWDPNASVVCHRHGSQCAIVTYGTLVNEAVSAADLLQAQGISASVVRLTKVTPLAVDALEAALTGLSAVLIVEETAQGAGIGYELVARLAERLPGTVFAVRDLGGKFVTHGKVDTLYRHCGLDSQAIASYTKEVLGIEDQKET